MSTTRERVMARMEANFAEHGQRLFWLSGFDIHPPAVREVVDELEVEGIVEWRFDADCPQCEQSWGGHPKNAPRRCRCCGYDILAEEGPEFFVADSFAWKRAPRVEVDVEARIAAAVAAERAKWEARVDAETVPRWQADALVAEEREACAKWIEMALRGSLGRDCAADLRIERGGK